MKRVIFSLIVLCATCGTAQQTVTIRGRVVDEEGNAVEYATIGIPGTRQGTLTDNNGSFTFKTDTTGNDTLLISHVSYEELRLAVKDIALNADITVTPKRLNEVTVFCGKKKKAKLAGRGMRVPGGTTMWTTANVGCEIGSLVETERSFEADAITFEVRHNSMDGAKLSINIYRADEENGKFTNMLCKPIYVEIPANEEKQEINIKVNGVVIEPGKWFVALKLVDYRKEGTKEGEETGNIFFPLYLKSSYTRSGIMEELESIPVNMGLKITGYEYR